MQYASGFAKTLQVHIFYTSSQKQLESPDSGTDIQFLYTKLKPGNFCSDTKISTTRLSKIMYKLWHFKIVKIGHNLHANMEDFHRAGHIYH